MKFKWNGEQSTFDVCRTMQQPDDMLVAFVIDTLDDNDIDTVPFEEFLGVEALAVVTMNFKSDGIDEHYEMVKVLHGTGSYNYYPKNLDLDM